MNATTKGLALVLLFAVSCYSTSPNEGLTGSWSGDLTEFVADGPPGPGEAWTLELHERGGALSGIAQGPDRSYALTGGRVGASVEILAVYPAGEVRFELQLRAGRLEGTARAREHSWPIGVALGFRARFERNPATRN